MTKSKTLFLNGYHYGNGKSSYESSQDGLENV